MNSTESTFQVLGVAFVNTLQGVVIGGSNLLIFLSIANYRALRDEKEYILIMALALADALAMAPYVTSGVYRIIEHLRGADLTVAKKPWECLLLPHKFLWLFSDHLQSYSLLLVSCDRLYLVAFPMSYLGQGKRYMWRLVLFFYLVAFSIGFLGVVQVLAAPQEPIMSWGCFIYRLLHTVHLFYHRNGPFMVAMLSVVVYLAVFPAYKLLLGKVSPLGGNQKRQMDRQRKMTKTLAISCVATLCLYCVPFKLAYTLLDANWYNAAMAMFVVVNCNSLANIFIYSARHFEIHTAIKGVIKRKVLPENIEMWPKPQTNANATEN